MLGIEFIVNDYEITSLNREYRHCLRVEEVYLERLLYGCEIFWHYRNMCPVSTSSPASGMEIRRELF